MAERKRKNRTEVTEPAETAAENSRAEVLPAAAAAGGADSSRMLISISVRTLVEFLLRSGDLDNRIPASSDDAMQAGSRMHRRLQKAAGADYRAEVPLQCIYEFPGEGPLRLSAVVEGRADGIYDGNLPDVPDSETAAVIDEIKTTYRNLEKMTAPEPVHLAQARCYAYIWCMTHDLPFVYIRMTYCNLDTEDIHYFYEKVTRQTLTEWFDDLMAEYRKWAEFTVEWMKIRTESIRRTEFPYPYRKGQKELAQNVYRTIVHQKKLFLEAPTGTGKTLAVLFPAVKAMGEGKAEKIFYLTARTVTSAVADESIELMRGTGLRMKNVILTARDKICAIEEPDCNPDSCPRARGHYDRINTALYDLLTRSDNFNRETIQACAEQYQVCPFELALDISLFSDTVICDYNYVFDPHVYLRRFFAEGSSRRNYIFLVDEAHNLVDRGRDMYSAELHKEGFLALDHAVGSRYPTLSEKLKKCNAQFLALKHLSMTGTAQWSPEDMAPLSDSLAVLYAEISRLLEEERRRSRRRKRKLSGERREIQEKILNFYFDLSHYLMIEELLDDHYKIYSESDGTGFKVRLFCMDPGRNLKNCMDRGIATILFSATLLPIQYYKKLLGGTEEDYEVYADPVFDPERQAVFIADDVTSRYTRRGEDEYDAIAKGIAGVISGRHGNYLVFFPSYAFLGSVADRFETGYRDPEKIECIRQADKMNEEARKQFLSRFSESSDEHSLLGFCVLGGIFSEGIDLKRDSLIGVIVVGTGIPQVCSEREMLKEYFSASGVNGYDYAYRYPGMNKVLQAAGRVIRTRDDVGIVALFDERFLTPGYTRLFPREWKNCSQGSVSAMGRLADRFWNEWL
jgi:Rad3-related DNA helicase